MHKKWIYGLGGILILIMVIIGIYHPAKQPNNHGIYIVTSLPCYQEAAQAVVGKYGKVVALINNASIDPHDFEPTTNDANAVATANIIIENGLEYDGWLHNMILAANQQHHVINVAKLMHKQPHANEHLWYDMQTMPTLTAALVRKCIQLEPNHRQQFITNGQKYIQKLTKLQQQETKLAQHPRQNVAVTEPVFDYALSQMNYHIIDRHFELAIENGTDPSPQDIAQLQKAIKQHQIAFLVNNIQTSDRIVNNLVTLAKQNHVPILNLTETMPNNQNYITWMQSQFNQLEQIQNDK
ncbi:MAG: zinc ABC transporter substrate-binding protein [Candidatus Paralactobacillus gallistercoris]|uniref:Zinc ABC transporter substrate-binding protein n=1 Tax=Candidatus Paralactobacillus gallistercoris TaxID=2838724 RepID=A0A948TKB5_9LACO|nr:zinc ABC transporter substrate-binding protein [Candidatus Paralactobacillus gallistercoris]